MPNIESIKAGAGKDPVFAEALENYQSLNARLEGANTYDRVLEAVERGAVNDGEDEMVVFDITGYGEGYEDEELDATTVPVEEIRESILKVKQNPMMTLDEVRALFTHIPVRNAIIAIWALENKTTED